MKESIKYILGSASISVYLDGKTFAVNKQSATFDLVVNAVRNGDIDELRKVVNVRDFIVSSLAKKSDKVRITENQIFYGEREITGLVATRVFEVIRLGLDVQPMIAFLENLLDNPSKRAVDELFGFMEACSLPITEDGHFLAYKRVRDNYTDVHSGKFDNSVGQRPSMDRNLVDEDKDRTCSTGLHFCSYDYLSSFSGSRIMVLKINPKDVVSIPSDYNNSKGRCCEYLVVDELDVNEYNGLPVHTIPDNYTDNYSERDNGDGAVPDDGDDEITAVPSVPLTVKQAIRNELNKAGATLTGLAKRFGLSPRTIGRIRDNSR